MTERLWVFSFLSLSSANRSSPFVWKNDQQRVRYSLHRRVDTHTNTKKKGEIKYLPRLVLLFVSESLAVSTKQNKKCAYCETCCGDRYAPTKKKKSVGIPKRKKRKWSISQSQIPWEKKKKKLKKKFLHSSTATLFLLLLLSFFRVYWKICFEGPPEKGCHSIAHNRNSRERERESGVERERNATHSTTIQLAPYRESSLFSYWNGEKAKVRSIFGEKKNKK